MESRYVELGKLFEDQEELEKLLSFSAEEAADYLRSQHNLEFTAEELNDIAAGMRRAIEETDSGEISEADLENVAGGKNSGAYNAGYYIGKGIKIVGTGISIAGGLVALGVISW